MASLFKYIVIATLLLVPGSAKAAEPFAVVELYTSEGCSSCPPADAFFSKLIEQSRRDGINLYALGFHVDYWNYLGWKDPYSKPAFSDRQRVYANVNKSKSVYTPQMIVNGKNAFSGNNFEVAQRAINSALNAEPSASLSLTLDSYDSNQKQLRIRYFTAGETNGTDLKLAVVERGLISSVPKGENAGRRLRHDNSVRMLESKRLRSAEGTIEVDLPEDLNREKASIIGFLQNSRTLNILAADGFDL